MEIYLDYNASAPIENRVLDVMVDVYKNSYGNADSISHTFGDQARKIVEIARSQVSHILGVEKNEVFFTSGSTESSNIAIRGLIKHANETGKRHVITSTIEHKAVLDTIKSLVKEGFEIDLIDPEEDGRIDSKKLLSLVRGDTILVSLMHANNETGVIQPVKEIGDKLDEKNVFFHIDATQSCGKLVTELKCIKYNMLSISAHKLSGPQGVGALVLRKKRYKLPPIQAVMYGGNQERGIRPGTIPVALVAGFGKACEIAETEYEVNTKVCDEIKTIIVNLIESSGLKYSINGNQEYCLPNTLNVSLLGVESEALMLATKNICGISNGSACNSNDYRPSYVLTAMGLSEEIISSAIRISWGVKTNKEKLAKQLAELLVIAKELVF